MNKAFWPEEWEQGLIKTKNAMGVMFKELSPSAVSFVEFAKIAKKPLLDIGAAYGVATLPAIENGANVIACDLSEEHLAILQRSVPEQHRTQLTTVAKKFPQELQFEDESLAGVMISNVLHFMDGSEVTLGLQKCWHWLVKGGKLFITVMTPHLSFYYQLIPEYQRRAASGEEWPGIFNPRLVASEKWKDNLPDFVHLFEIDTLERAVVSAGFTIESMKYFCYQNYPDAHRQDGKEFISLVATKS